MINLRLAEPDDVDILFNWANDITVRENSYNPQVIEYTQHVKWFKSKIISVECAIYIFSDEQNMPIGYVRIEKKVQEKQAIISIAIDSFKRGKGYSAVMLKVASAEFFKSHHDYGILAYVMKRNEPSYKAFLKAGYTLLREDVIQNIPSLVLYKSNNV